MSETSAGLREECRDRNPLNTSLMLRDHQCMRNIHTYTPEPQLPKENTANSQATNTLYKAKQKHAAGCTGLPLPREQGHQEPGQTQGPTGLLGTTREQRRPGNRITAASKILLGAGPQGMGNSPTAVWLGSQRHLAFVHRRPE